MADTGTTVINIRNAPENLVRRAKSRAAMEGKTLKDFVLEAIEKALQSNGSPSARGSI